MTIFRHKETGVLYTIALVSPRMYTGSWFEATVYNRPKDNYPTIKFGYGEGSKIFDEVGFR
jgi:hypothetical protein